MPAGSAASLLQEQSSSSRHCSCAMLSSSWAIWLLLTCSLRRLERWQIAAGKVLRQLWLSVSWLSCCNAAQEAGMPSSERALWSP